MKTVINAAGCAVVSAGLIIAAAQPSAAFASEDVGLSSERLERIGTVFQAEIDEGRLPGAVVAIARGGEVAYFETFGYRDIEADAVMEEDSIFRIYSMSKPLVSVAAIILMEEGHLDLTDPVAEYLPEFSDMTVGVRDRDSFGRVSYREVPAEREMTVQDLLRHTAGLAYGEITGNETVRDAYAEAGVYQPDGLPFNSRDLEPDEQVEKLAQVPLIHQPGTVWEYSLASDVLGRVVERVTDQRLGGFLEARVFEPLGMDDTGFYVPEDSMHRLAEPLPEDPVTGERDPFMDVSEPPANDSGGAGAVSTAEDYLTFARMLANGGTFEGTQILSPTSVRLMTADHLGPDIEAPLNPGELVLGTPGHTFGLGFGVREGAGVAGVPGGAGQFFWAGFGGTYFWIDPEDDITAVMMTQRVQERARYRRLITQLVHQAIVD